MYVEGMLIFLALYVVCGGAVTLSNLNHVLNRRDSIM